MLLLLIVVIASTVDRDSFCFLSTLFLRRCYIVVLVMQLSQVIAQILLVLVHYPTCILIAEVGL